MSTLRTPVGPQPPSVYWRRRLVVLLGLLAIVVIIVLIVVRPGGENVGQETPKPTDTASNEPSAPPVAGGDCNPATLVIEPIVDAGSYQAGQQPQLSVQLTNTGSSPCTLSVGADQLVFSIVSGSDPIWTSSDCLTTPAFEVELQPGQPLPNNPIAWDRTRSSPDTCDSSRPEVVAGGATYRLGVTLGTAESEIDAPFLLY
jgi:hypothetical protein